MLKFKVEETYYLYWLHEKIMTDIKTQGYVGVTKVPTKRYAQHTSYMRGSSSEYKSNLAAQLQSIAIEDIVMEILYKGSKKEMFAKEEYLRPEVEIGWNVVKGGGRTAVSRKGFKHSEETKKLMSKLQKGKPGKPNKFKGVTNRHSEEMKVHLGSFHKGKTISEEHRKSASKKNRLNSPQNKYISIYHKGKNISCMYRSIAEASRDLEASQANLKNVVRRRKTTPFQNDKYIVDWENSHPLLGVKSYSEIKST